MQDGSELVADVVETAQAIKVEATEISRRILRLVHPDRADIPANEAMADVRAVLDLEAALKSAIVEAQNGGYVSAIDWRALAAVTIRKLREANK